MARTGRRPGVSGSREAILAAARSGFADHGYDGTTIRGIARDAGVDPALVRHYFGTKEQVFAAALEFPFDPATVLPTVLGDDLAGAGERLVRFLVTTLETPAGRAPFLAILRSAVRYERAATMLRGFVGREVVTRLARQIEHSEPELRATLVGSQLVGLVMVRYVVQVEPLASAEPEAVVQAVAPTIQRYLDGELAVAERSLQA